MSGNPQPDIVELTLKLFDTPEKIAFNILVFLSALFYGWLLYRLNRRGNTGRILLSALAWASVTTYIITILDNPLIAIQYFAFQSWLAGLFLLPGMIRRDFRLWRTIHKPSAAEIAAKQGIERLKERYRESAFNRGIGRFKDRLPKLSIRQERIVSIAICLLILAYMQFFEK